MTELGTFYMLFTNVVGGPCPACGESGELRGQFGTWGAEGQRTIIHTKPGQPESRCTVDTGSGVLIVTNDSSWSWVPNKT